MTLTMTQRRTRTPRSASSSEAEGPPLRTAAPNSLSSTQLLTALWFCIFLVESVSF